ncbi:MAG: Na/Pi symporter [Dehalococcoidia bacterium]|nr:Na/Pi symporter [Dehalococcoidia bacterium]
MADRASGATSFTSSSSSSSGIPILRVTVAVTLLYIFLVGISMLSSGIKGLGAGFQDRVLENVDNPLAGLFAGILATVLVQSSSVTTSTIVGLVGTGTISVEIAVPMIMGANIGTTITNTLVALGSARRSEEFRRAFAAATMHDFFNITTVVIFFPLELWTGFLTIGAEFLADLVGDTGWTGGETDSPIKRVVKWPVSRIKDIFESVIDSDQLVATLLVAGGIALIFASLFLVSRNMRLLIAGRIESGLNSVVSRGGGAVGAMFGTIITVAVQSSSITTSVVVPLVGSGVFAIRNAYSITLGANVGTPVTALLASLAVDLRAGLVIALHHVLFNLGGVALHFLLYPAGDLRYTPVRLAEWLAELAVRRRAIVGVYVVGMFLIVPLTGIVVLR